MNLLIDTQVNVAGEWSKELPDRNGRGTLAVQVDIPAGAAATVAIYGRIDESFPEVLIATRTTAGIEPIIYVSHLRVTVSGISLANGTQRVRVGVV